MVVLVVVKYMCKLFASFTLEVSVNKCVIVIANISLVRKILVWEFSVNFHAPNVINMIVYNIPATNNVANGCQQVFAACGSKAWHRVSTLPQGVFR